MRWNRTITLLSPVERYQDDEGSWHEGERTSREVFCNEMTIGTMAQAHLRSSDVRLENSVEPVDRGLHHEHMVQLRSIEYQGEDKCIFDGEEYEVIYITGSGEMKLLTIAQRLGNI